VGKGSKGFLALGSFVKGGQIEETYEAINGLTISGKKARRAIFPVCSGEVSSQNLKEKKRVHRGRPAKGIETKFKGKKKIRGEKSVGG